MHEADDHGDSLDVSELCKNLKKLQEGETVEIISEPESDIITETEEETEPPEVENISEEQKPEEETAPKEPSSTASAPITKSEKKGGQIKNETIRVKVDLLNKLMELTGEIVLGRNQLLRQFSDMGNKTTLLAMAHMISDLQQLVLQTRMQPIGSTFTKFNRIVRDLAKQLDKPIRLNIKGEDTELDRSIIESLSDPLTHLIRNCADHGLEDQSTRLANGKERKVPYGWRPNMKEDRLRFL